MVVKQAKNLQNSKMILLSVLLPFGTLWVSALEHAISKGVSFSPFFAVKSAPLSRRNRKNWLVDARQAKWSGVSKFLFVASRLAPLLIKIRAQSSEDDTDARWSGCYKPLQDLQP